MIQLSAKNSTGNLRPAKGLEERCKLPSGVWGETQAANDFGTLWGTKNSLDDI